jgi:hypothetical protein
MSDERALPLRVYVPREGTAARAAIAEHSGVVGTAVEGGRVVVDFEGNLYGAANIKTYADAVHHAAGRHAWGAEGYPTRARTEVDEDEVLEVGFYNGERVQVYPEQVGTVADWLGVGEERLEAECQRTE